MKTAEIKLTVTLDDNNVPEHILWESTDSTNKEALPVKSMMLALWDQSYKNTLRIDLWTKDMPVDEMKRFFMKPCKPWATAFYVQPARKILLKTCATIVPTLPIKWK